MSWADFDRPLILLVGPTGVGKTALAVDLAELLSAEIVSADSRYFYRGMNIGTAKPTKAEMRSITHHMVDIVAPDQTFSLSDFQRMAKSIIEGIHQNEILPILVGGTGQYIRAVMEDWQMPEEMRDDRLREILSNEVETAGRDILYAFLQKVDPSAASQIDPRNKRRTLRAVEVILKTGRRFSDQRIRNASPYSRKMIGLWMDRTALYARIDARIVDMIASGLVAEVDQLLQQGYNPHLSSMSAIGYREICKYLQGEISLDEAVMIMKRNTRQFVRRQSNWFRMNDPTIHWFQAGNTRPQELFDFIQSNQGWILPGK